MRGRKNRTIPVVITLIVIIIIVSFFANIKQTEIVCEKAKKFDKDVLLEEQIVTKIDGKKVNQLLITKTIILPPKYSGEEYLNKIKKALDRTLEYLGNKVKYRINENRITIDIDVSKNETVLLDNISFVFDNDLEIVIDSNTKSEDVITLAIGDNYTDGEFKQYMKSKGYNCK